jgi:hypothetical protein
VKSGLLIRNISLDPYTPFTFSDPFSVE